MHLIRKVTLSLGVVLISTAVSRAEDLQLLADSAKSSFQPLTADDLATARERLAERVAAAEGLLNSSTEFGARWLSFLAWEGVQKQLAPGAEPDLAAARETLRRLSSGADGLDRPELQQVADALEDYIVVASFAPAPGDRQVQSFEATIDGLAERLGDPAALRSARGSHEVERRLALLAGLDSLGRDDELMRRVRTEYGLPNAYVEIDTPTLNQLVGRSVNDCAGLTDCILGTSIRGTGATNGLLTVSTLPSDGRAQLLFRLSGSNYSNTIGVNGPVQIRSVGTTNFSAAKLVTLSDDRFAVSPASANATTRTRTQSVSKIGGGLGSRLIERIARQRVADQKAQAEAIAADHAEIRVKNRLNEELGLRIAEARGDYDARFTRRLRQRRANPRSIDYRTTSNSLTVDAVLADGRQLAAWDSPPVAVAAPISARLHQTAVNNLLDAYLGGATLRRESVEEPTKINIVAPEWLELKADPPAEGEAFQPWSLRLRADRPISIELHEGKLTAIIHAEQMRVEDKTYDNWDLVAVYEPQAVEGRWRLLRQGDIDVLPTRFDPASGGRLTSSEVGMRNNLSDALNKGDRFPATIEIDPIDLSERNGPVKNLLMEGMVIHEGWMAIGWRAE
jgi:hypothetical protein